MLDKAPVHKCVRARVMTFLISGVCAAAAFTITPTTTSADAVTTKKMDHRAGHFGKMGLCDRSTSVHCLLRREKSVYDGNWGYAPGGYQWNPNDLWHRSRGFWETNSPACPFRSC